MRDEIMMSITRGGLGSLAAAVGLAAALPALAEPPSWAVADGESRIGIVGTQTGAPFEAAFEVFDADIVFDPDDLAASRVTVLVDITSFSSGNSDRDDTAMGSQWFDSTAFPQAQFEASTFRHLGDNRYEADGSLSIRDLTQDVTLPFALDIEADTARMHAELEVDRTAYGLGQGDFASDELVGYGVTIIVDLTAQRGG